MKKIKIIFLLPLLLSGINCMSQDEDLPPVGDRVESLRVSIYTYTLGLTSDQAKVFWPVFNNYQSELQGIKKEERMLRRQCMTNLNSMSDKDIENAVDKLLNYEDQELQLKKKYYGEFKKVLPIRQVILLPKAELEFKRALLNKLKERKNDK